MESAASTSYRAIEAVAHAVNPDYRFGRTALASELLDLARRTNARDASAHSMLQLLLTIVTICKQEAGE